MTNFLHYTQYCRAHGYDEEGTVQVRVDDALSPGYPVALKCWEDRRIILLAKVLAPAAQPLLEAARPDWTLPRIMAFLFDEGFAYETERSFIGALPAQPQSEPGFRPLGKRDWWKLRRFLGSLSPRERLLTQIKLSDEVLLGCEENGKLVCVASAVREGELYDISVATHPDFRGQGLGCRALGALRGAVPPGALLQYRADEANAASAALMAKAGYEKNITLYGAIAKFQQ